MSRLFTGPETWLGASYELAIELGPHSDGRLQTALEAIWNRQDLDGCYANQDVEPGDQPRIRPRLDGRMLGVVTLPGGGRVACGTSAYLGEDGIDWAGFDLPLGALSTAYPVGGFPFGNDAFETSRDWREPLDDWLVQMARDVFAVTPFPLALIGFDVGGEVYAQDLQTTGIPKIESRRYSYLRREGDRLVWHPAG